jgi:hypothetical protein
MPAKILDQDWVHQNRYIEDKDGCWNWKGSVEKDGYGKCGLRSGSTLAHRAFYGILVGKIPSGLELDHLCKNRKCVNPKHLEPVTHVENISRGIYTINHRNGRKTHCKRGHPFDDKNTYVETYNGIIMRKCVTCRNTRQRERWRLKGAAKLSDG